MRKAAESPFPSSVTISPGRKEPTPSGLGEPSSSSNPAASLNLTATQRRLVLADRRLASIPVFDPRVSGLQVQRRQTPTIVHLPSHSVGWVKSPAAITTTTPARGCRREPVI